MIKFDKEKVLLLHRLIAEETGGSVGVRDTGLLESALNNAYATFDGEYLYKTLKDKGVLVRYFRTERIKDHVRITIGSDQDMQILVDKIKEILGEIK